MNGIAPASPGKTHLVLCGLPRSGATLLYAMIRGDDDPLITFQPPMQPAIEANASASHIVSKRPQDIFEIDAITAAAAEKDKRARFMVSVRDIRGLALARHMAFPHQPAFDADHGLIVGGGLVSYHGPGLLTYCEAIEKTRSRTDVAVHIVRFEDLLRAPAAEKAKLADFSGIDGWKAEIASDAPPVTAPIEPHDHAGSLTSWRRDRAGAASVVRLFRLTPQLFDYLEAWGYETDRRWHDALAAFAPAGLDDSPGMIVAFHSDDRLYTREAERLTASANRLGLPIEVVRLPDQGDWTAHNRYKVAFIKAARERHRGPIFYLDIDTVIQADPWPILRGYTGDAALCTRRNGGAYANAILLNDTAGARIFIEDWERRLSRHEQALPVKMLNKILRDQRMAKPIGYVVQLLPEALCQPFDDEAASGRAIIELLHAGRERHPASSDPKSPLARRHLRIAELDASFTETEIRANV